jgi:predicted PurR-regulated permease PerM
MSVRSHFIFWTLAVFALLGFVFVFKGVLLPFVLGAGVAYLLNPAVNTLGRCNIARGPAALLILGGFFLVVFALLAVISPLVYKQSLQLIQDFPGYIERVIAWVEPQSQKALEALGLDADVDLRGLVQNYGASAFGVAGGVAERLAGCLAAGGQAAMGFVSLIVFMPLVAYFLIKEWPALTHWVEGMLPRDQKETIGDLLSQIDQKISGFVRGQISVAVILGLVYAIALTVAGLKYGFLIGLGAGLLSVIPMVGSVVGLIVAVAVAWFQAGDLVFVGIIAAIFLIGQLIEGNLLTPKLVGDSVGLHPLWIFFALLAGGSLFGILGMFLAVPVAAVAGVLLVFAIGRYKMSAFYKASAKPQKAAKKKAAPKKKVKNADA